MHTLHALHTRTPTSLGMLLAFSPLHASWPKMSVKIASVLCQGDRIVTGIFNFPIHLTSEKYTENVQVELWKDWFFSAPAFIRSVFKKTLFIFPLAHLFSQHQTRLQPPWQRGLISLMKSGSLVLGAGIKMKPDVTGLLCFSFLSVHPTWGPVSMWAACAQ